MQGYGTDSIMSMDITASPSSSMQCVENSSPMSSSIKNLYSKLISSCQRSEHLSAVLTPENKVAMNRIASPFVKSRSSFNPFNRNLRERLENPIFSPSVFSTVISPSQDSNEFKWTIDDLSKINPASIEEEFHFEEHVDEQVETEMQKSIDRYFTKNHKVPSPWDCKLPTNWHSFAEIFKKEKQNVLLNDQVNPTISSSPYPCSVSQIELVSRTPCQNASTQTSLSLPPDLPENITSLLKPYLSDTSFDEMNVSMNNSLRRKLFFQKEDERLSTANFLRANDASPALSNCFPSTPSIRLRTEGSPLENFSPLDISPINRVDKAAVCNKFSSGLLVDVTEGFHLENDPASEKENMPPSEAYVRNQHQEECFKVFESPKISSNNRRARKRRRSPSRDMDMSISYSNFSAKHNSTGQSIPKFCVCDDETKMNFDTYTGNVAESQDTGYGSVSTCTASFEKLTAQNDSDLKLVTFNSWINSLKDKTNAIIASTPTKK